VPKNLARVARRPQKVKKSCITSSGSLIGSKILICKIATIHSNIGGKEMTNLNSATWQTPKLAVLNVDKTLGGIFPSTVEGAFLIDPTTGDPTNIQTNDSLAPS